MAVVDRQQKQWRGPAINSPLSHGDGEGVRGGEVRGWRRWDWGDAVTGLEGAGWGRVKVSVGV